MFFQNRDDGRRFFFQVWNNFRKGNRQLEPLGELVLDVILSHPEYHQYLANEEDAVTADFMPESGQTNPFLHMGMHIAIKEQVGSNRPEGISTLYQEFLNSTWQDSHELEHGMMECLGEILWQAQRNNALPDEQAYMECLKRLK